jgi:hypothetical protein
MGKSTVMVDQGLHIAHDLEHWHGYPVEADYWVAYICGESADSALAYVKAWYEQRPDLSPNNTRFLFSEDCGPQEPDQH